MAAFGARLQRAVGERIGLCVGIDPHPELLEAWGYRDDVDGLRSFALRAAAALAQHVAVLKPQSAFFERHGSRGVGVLEETVAACRDAGALVVLDAKRGDIGSTARAYADAYLRPGCSLPADALTVSPYLGFGSLTPFVEAAGAVGAGLFVLARTSNPEGVEVQDARAADGRTVAQLMVDHVAALNAAETAAGAPLGSLGVVVGGTVGPGAVDLSALGGPVLVPGLGAQGATADDVAAATSGAALVLASTSRDVLRAGPDAEALVARAQAVAAAL
ncbi:orotidine-5'-phosphate decarboxylase [Cumulibacter manganitolerans]|uniref:orotidine-5'-phosphate decarboxylase n=1 Tax=Cumulibacter manganitolerans TaxID=1884992 RepID=UPI001294EB53|nr:orotidine-5'-phosphate decarboxylase [Cumulibacter manganitolerans]